MTDEKIMETIYWKLDDAFNDAMFDIENEYGCTTGDCDPLLSHAITVVLEEAAKEAASKLVEYAKQIVELNKP